MFKKTLGEILKDNGLHKLLSGDESTKIKSKVWAIIPDNFPKAKYDKLASNGNLLKMVSFRWIDYCINFKYVVKEIEKNRLVYLLPFPCDIPIADFQGKSIGVKVFIFSKF